MFSLACKVEGGGRDRFVGGGQRHKVAGHTKVTPTNQIQVYPTKVHFLKANLWGWVERGEGQRAETYNFPVEYHLYILRISLYHNFLKLTELSVSVRNNAQVIMDEIYSYSGYVYRGKYVLLYNYCA